MRLICSSNTRNLCPACSTWEAQNIGFITEWVAQPVSDMWWVSCASHQCCRTCNKQEGHSYLWWWHQRLARDKNIRLEKTGITYRWLRRRWTLNVKDSIETLRSALAMKDLLRQSSPSVHWSSHDHQSNARCRDQRQRLATERALALRNALFC